MGIKFRRPIHLVFEIIDQFTIVTILGFAVAVSFILSASFRRNKKKQLPKKKVIFGGGYWEIT